MRLGKTCIAAFLFLAGCQEPYYFPNERFYDNRVITDGCNVASSFKTYFATGEFQQARRGAPSNIDEWIFGSVLIGEIAVKDYDSYRVKYGNSLTRLFRYIKDSASDIGNVGCRSEILTVTSMEVFSGETPAGIITYEYKH